MPKNYITAELAVAEPIDRHQKTTVTIKYDMTITKTNAGHEDISNGKTVSPYDNTI